MTSINAVIRADKEGISDRKILSVMIDGSKKRSKAREINFLKRAAEELSFDLIYVSQSEISAVTTGTSHGGIVALCSERTVPPLDGVTLAKDGFYVMIEGIEDPYNFGYAIRSIYAAGADGLIVSPRNWLSAAGVVCRSSAGASELIPAYMSGAEGAIKKFKREGYKCFAAGIRDSVSAYDADLSKPLFLTVGGEKRGISSKILAECDGIIRLDYGREFKASLSAASAASILAYEVFRQNKRS